MRVGWKGEDAAVAHLRAEGYRVLARNYRTRRGEIDIVAQRSDILVFVEVKSRKSEKWGRPGAAVDRKKRIKLGRAIQDYLKEHRYPRTVIRMDIIEIVGDMTETPEIRHLENAFRPPGSWRYH